MSIPTYHVGQTVQMADTKTMRQHKMVGRSAIVKKTWALRTGSQMLYIAFATPGDVHHMRLHSIHVEHSGNGAPKP